MPLILAVAVLQVLTFKVAPICCCHDVLLKVIIITAAEYVCKGIFLLPQTYGDRKACGNSLGAT